MYIKVRVINRMRQRYEFCLLTCTTIGEKFFRRQREESVKRTGKSGRGNRKTISPGWRCKSLSWRYTSLVWRYISLGWRWSFREGLGRFSGGVGKVSGGIPPVFNARINGVWAASPRLPYNISNWLPRQVCPSTETHEIPNPG